MPSLFELSIAVTQSEHHGLVGVSAVRRDDVYFSIFVPINGQNLTRDRFPS